MRLVLLLLAVASAAVRAEGDVAGRWEGPVKVPGRELQLIVDLVAENGRWNGSVTIPGLGLRGAALGDVALNGDELIFTLKTALADPRSGPAKFSAHLAPAGKLSGDFVQAGNSAPFVLEKTGPPQVEPARRSSSITKEAEGEWHGGYELFGYPRKVTLKLQNGGAEGATAEFVIVGRKENKLPVDLVMQEGEFLSVDSHETGLSFEGRVRNGEIKGTILQGPLEIPVVMRREK